MLGVSLALLSSLFWGTNDYFSKRLLIKGLDENFTLWVRFPIAFFLLTPLGILYWDFNIKVLTYALIWLPLEVLGGVLLISTFFFGFNVVIGKASIIESNSFFFSWFYALCMSFGTLVFVKPSQIIKKENYKHWEIPLLGLFFAIGDILYNLALLLTLSPYVASAERLSLLVAIFYGRVFLKEETRGIVLPAFLMIVGNLLMAFG